MSKNPRGKRKKRRRSTGARTASALPPPRRPSVTWNWAPFIAASFRCFFATHFLTAIGSQNFGRPPKKRYFSPSKKNENCEACVLEVAGSKKEKNAKKLPAPPQKHRPPFCARKTICLSLSALKKNKFLFFYAPACGTQRKGEQKEKINMLKNCRKERRMRERGQYLNQGREIK